MSTTLNIFGLIYKRSLVASLLGSAIFLFFLLFVIYSVLNGKDLAFNSKGIYFFLVITISLQLLFLISWGNQLRELIFSYQSRILPNFYWIYWKVFLLLVVIGGLMPLMTVSFVVTVPTAVILYVVFSAILYVSASAYSQTLAVFCSLLSFIIPAFEKGRVDAHPEVVAFDYLPIDINILLVIGCVICLIAFHRLLQSEIIRNTSKQLESNQEFVMKWTNRTIFSLWLGQKILHCKYYLHHTFFTAISNRLSVVLWSQQNWGILFWRLLLFVLVLASFIFDWGIWKGFNSALQDDNLSFTILMMLWGLLGGFDQSIFSRMRFAQKFTWLREPIDGFSTFKTCFFNRMLKSAAIEVVLTSLTYYLIVYEVADTVNNIAYFMISFLSFKFYSVLMSYLTVHYKVKHLGTFAIVMSYAAFIIIWGFYTKNNPDYDLGIVVTVLFTILITLSLGYRWFKKTNIQNQI